MLLQRLSVFSFLSLSLALLPSPALAGVSAPEIFIFDLTGDQEVPPVTTSSRGGCLGKLDEGATTFEVTCTHDVVGATLFHIHEAPFGVNGGIVFDLGDPTSPVNTTWSSMTAGEIAKLRAGDYYINLHTDGRPGGIVRGQIVHESFDTLFFADGSQQVPPSVSTATGTCVAELNDAATELTVGCTHDVADVTAAHIHTGAPGVNGPVLLDFGDPTSPFADTKTGMTDIDVANLAAGFLYVNIHSVEDPDGEIRGQITGQLIFTDGFESGDTASWSFAVP